MCECVCACVYGCPRPARRVAKRGVCRGGGSQCGNLSPSPVTRLSHDLSFVNVTCASGYDPARARPTRSPPPTRGLPRPVYILDYFSITGKCFRLDDCLLFFHQATTTPPPPLRPTSSAPSVCSHCPVCIPRP